MRNVSLAPARVFVQAALALHTALKRASELVVPAELTLIDNSAGLIRTGLLHTAAKLRLADHLAAGPLTAAELAPKVNADADALHRTLRALAMIGIFSLDSAGRFRNNRLSEKLRADVAGSFRIGAQYWGSASNFAAWGDALKTVETGEPAFARVHGVSAWDWMRDHPDENEIFTAYMQEASESLGPMVARAYSFAGVQKVCDLGGGRGMLLAGILKAHPRLRGAVMDSPHVVERAKSYLDGHGLGGRVDIVPCDFFEHVPSGCDVYVMKDILHDWNDRNSLAILRNVRKSLPPGGRILIVELLVEECDTRMPGPITDVHMMTVLEGRQRSTADLGKLFAESGFRLGEVRPLPIPWSVVEGIAV